MKQDTAERQQWLIETLYALRGHFRDAAPPDPEDLMMKGNRDAEGSILHCIDSRGDEKKHLHLAPGEYFDSTAVGASVPPVRADNLEERLHTKIQLGYPVMSVPKARNIIIMGHTGCGANLELYNALLSDATPKDGTKAAWMLPMAPKGLKRALKEANGRGADVQEMLRIVEQTTVLKSMQHLYHYRFDDITVKNHINEGKLHIIGAIRDLQKDKEGKYPLLVYDPRDKEFRKIEDLYDEAFPGHGKRTAEAIEERMKHVTPVNNGVFVPVHRLEVPRGAKSRTVAEINVADIDAGIRVGIDKIRAMGQTR